ncbi:MAG TPA: MMPL family transporter [Candidatus Kapabacteria bacterium]|nr:MMPL family transporter [Candidatus Kapabacteria bacterium]
MKFIGDFIVFRPITTLLIMFLLSAAAISGVTKLETRNNQDSELPDTDPIVATKHNIDAIFGDKGVVVIGIEADNVYNPSTLQKIKDISEELKSVQYVLPDQIASLASANNVKSRDWGLDVGPFMRDVPTTPEEIEQLKADVRANTLVDGRLVTRDGTFTLISANVEEDYDQATVFDQVYKIVEKYQGPEKIYANGDPIFTQEIELGLQRDADVLVPIALLIIMIGLYFFFRTLRGVFLPALVIVLCIGWIMGLMGHLGLPQTVVSTAIPLLMVAIATSYGVHALLMYYEETVGQDQKTAVRNMLAKLFPVLSFVAFTTLLGTSSLVVFDVLSIREFAVEVMIGTGVAYLMTVTVIPAALSLMKAPTKVPTVVQENWLDGALVRLTEFSVRHKYKVLGGYGVLVAICVVGIVQLKTGVDVTAVFPSDHRGRVSFDKFSEKLGGGRYFNVMVEAPDAEGIKDPALLKTILDYQQFIEQQAGVGYTYSFANVVRHISHLVNENYSGNDIPATREELAQCLLLYDMSAQPGEFTDLVDNQYQRAKIRVMLDTSDPDDHIRLYEMSRAYLEQHLPDNVKIEFGGDTMFWIAQVRYVVIGKIENIISGILLIVLFVTVISRSFVAGMISISPAVIGSVLAFGVMGFSGIRLEISAALITSIAIGIGTDFSIHYLGRLREFMPTSASIDEALVKVSRSNGKAIVYDTASNVLGFAVLLLSGFLQIRTFGSLVSLTMIVMAAGTLMLIPALVAAIQPAYLYKRREVSEPPVTPAPALSAE